MPGKEYYQHGTCLGCGVVLPNGGVEQMDGYVVAQYHCERCRSAYAQRPSDAPAVDPGWNKRTQ